MTPAQYRGVIPTPEDIKTYEEACDPKLREDATSSLWMAVLLFQFPVTSGYRFTPERHPAEGSLLRVDMDVYALRNQDRHTLLYVEWKTASKDSPTGRRDAEKQVLRYCKEYLTANPGQPFMHAMVCAGPHATIWKVHQNPKTVDQEEENEDEDTEPDEPHVYIDAKATTPNALSQGFEEVRRSRP